MTAAFKPTRSGFVTFKGGKTYYKIFGRLNGRKPPLLVLHGGPGSAHNYLLGLSALARGGRAVVFYDQFGAGRSSSRRNQKLWKVSTYLKELDSLRLHLGLTNVHLLGHSWGGMLAIDYLLTRPTGIVSTVLSSAMISMPLYQREVEKLKRDLPPKTYRALKRHERAGTTGSAEYQAAYTEYKARHILRGGIVTPSETWAPPNPSGPKLYRKLWGVSEAYANGTLRSWDRTGRLSEITAPALVISGQYDELTPAQAVRAQAELPNAELAILTASSHLGIFEQPRTYLGTVGEFLNRIEKRQR